MYYDKLLLLSLYLPVVVCVQLTEKDGFVINSLLSIPIFDGEKQVIGVMQMMNKLNGKPFAENDKSSLEVPRKKN